MDLPNLLSKFNKQTKEEVRQFLAVEISHAVVKSAVWQVRHNRTEIVSIGSLQSYENTDQDENLITAIDTSLADALGGMEKEPNDVIFGLPETWVTGAAIADQQKPTLKLVCHKLQLKPVGFVVTTEALINYLEDNEGSPPSAILINISVSEIAVSLAYLGKLDGTQVVGRSEQLSSDVEEGIARFPHSENLPSRMILFDGREDLEGIKQELIAVDWQAKLPFLHFPKIESLPKDFTIQAIALSGGQEVASSLGLQTKIDDSHPPKEKPATTKPVPMAKAEYRDEASESEAGETSVSMDPGGLDNDAIMSDDLSIPDLSTEFGFSGSKPASPQEKAPLIIKSPKPLVPPLVPPLDPAPVKPKSITLPRFKLPHFSFPHFEPPLSGLKTRTASSSVRFKKLKASTIVILALGLLSLLVVGLTLAYWYLPTATLTIKVRPQAINREVTFILDPAAKTMNIPEKTIPAVIQNLSESAEKSFPATGIKTVGDAAKGSVTLYNRTTSSKVFAKGTILRAQSLAFSLNEEVRLASASAKENADFSLTIVPSSIDVGISASAIGEASNIASNTQFSVANFSTDTYVAQNKVALSGGFAKEVAVVSAKDISDATASVVSELQSRISQKALAAAGSDFDVVSAGEPEVIDSAVDPLAGTEAESLTLQATVALKLYQYQKNDLTVLGQELLKDQIPSNFKLLPEQTTLRVASSTASKTSATATINANISLMLLPNINENEIVRSIRGKRVDLVKPFLETLPNYVMATTVISPAFPGPLYTYPQRPDRITVTIKSQ